MKSLNIAAKNITFSGEEGLLYILKRSVKEKEVTIRYIQTIDYTGERFHEYYVYLQPKKFSCEGDQNLYE